MARACELPCGKYSILVREESQTTTKSTAGETLSALRKRFCAVAHVFAGFIGFNKSVHFAFLI